MAYRPATVWHTHGPTPVLNLTSPSLAASRWSGVTDKVCAHGAYVNLVEDTFARHEVDIVDLIQHHKVKRVFLTGHSLGGGIANIAHLVVRGQLKKAGSPWAKLVDQVTWLACTFASPQTIVRKYDPETMSDEATKTLVSELDTSSYNFVYGCDAVPRILGMLKYLGGLLETVVPKIADDGLNNVVNGLSWVKKLVTHGILRVANAEQRIDDAGQAAVKLLKSNGLSEVVAQFTHIGMVVYQAPEAKEYQYLVGKADIDEVLDVNGEKFTELLGDPKKLRQVSSCRALTRVLQVHFCWQVSSQAPCVRLPSKQSGQYGLSCAWDIMHYIGLETRVVEVAGTNSRTPGRGRGVLK